MELLGRSEEVNADQRVENNDDKPESTGAELGEAMSSDTIEADQDHDHDHDPRALDGDSGENDQSDGAGNGWGDGDDDQDGLVTEPAVETTAVEEEATPVVETAVVDDATGEVAEFGGDATEAAAPVEEVAAVEEVAEPVVETAELGRDDDHADEIFESNDGKPASTGTELGEAATSRDTMEADGKLTGLDENSGENEQSDGVGAEEEVGDTFSDRMTDEGKPSGSDDDVVSEERIDIVQLLLSKGVEEKGVSSDDGDIGDIPLHDVGDTHDSLDSGGSHEDSTEEVVEHNDDKPEDTPKSRG